MSSAGCCAAPHGTAACSASTVPSCMRWCDTVIAENPAYPELAEKRELIKKVVLFEEESFGRTIDQGLALLDTLLAKMSKAKEKILSGADAFRLNDTYGFPLDLTMDILEERGMTVDETAFHALMNEQKERARKARKSEEGEAWKGDGAILDGVTATAFVGYDSDEAKASILAIVKDGERAAFAGIGDRVSVVLDKTPFYGESGGQIGDTGLITGEGVRFAVRSTSRTANGHFIHNGVVEDGALSVGAEVTASIDGERRMAIRRNHTAAHLLQAALRKVLGTHVEQAGQLVTDHSVRFDFTHFSALTEEELNAVEREVNRGDSLRPCGAGVRDAD